jgi:hypothetical protein
MTYELVNGNPTFEVTIWTFTLSRSQPMAASSYPALETESAFAPATTPSALPWVLTVFGNMQD